METKVTIVLFMMTLVVLFAIPMQSVHAQDTVFGEPIKLTNSASAQFPEIDVSGSNVYVVWEGDRNKIGKPKEITNLNAEIFFRVSNDNGETFGPVINLSNIYGFSTGPKIASSGSNVYVAWMEAPPAPPDAGGYIEPGNYDVLFRVSNDNGETFGPVINLSDSDELSGSHSIALSGDNVYVIYVELGVGVFLRISNDNGATFGPPVSLDIGWNPEIAVSGSNVYVLGTAGLKVSNDNGATFGSIIKIGPYDVTSIAASGSNVYIAYGTNPAGATNENPEIFLRVSSDNGATFGSPVNLSNDPWFSRDVEIVAFENSVYAVWVDTSPQKNGNFDVLFRASNDNGETFGSILNPTNKVGHSAAPKTGVSGSYVHVIWLSKVSADWDFDIAYSRSPPTANSLVPTPPPPSSDPSLTTLEVSIDVKPASTSNTINCEKQKGSISVGLYTEDGFDAQDVDISTIELQGVEAKKYLLKDLDSDGDLDGVARFSKAALCESGEILSLSSTRYVTLAGSTSDGNQFEGTDIIRFRR